MDESNNTDEKQKPWLFQPGVSGNPKGRPKGSISLKEFARRMLQELPDEDKLEFMKGLPKDVVWRMAEGNPQTDVTSKGEKLIPTPILGGISNEIHTNHSSEENPSPEEKA